METASFGSSVQPFEEPEARSLAGLFRNDALLLLAGVGLIGCSVYVLAAATENDIPGNPHYYVIRQAVYGGVGIVLMLLLSRFDYSRLRELKLGLYGAMIALICLVFALGATARGSQRWISLPFFNLQPSEVGKVFL
ncbi:MAG: FtsW/RodA/SpoVE family cell cycle protein, partial [Solirubrobacterales bacterium]